MKYKELSNNATGIELKCTNISTDNRRAFVTSLNIEPLKDSFTLEYYVERLDSNGVPYEDVKFMTKKIKFKDIPEIGTVDYDENLNEIEGTYSKVSDEDLVVTNWYKQVGALLLGSAITFIKAKENI